MKTITQRITSVLLGLLMPFQLLLADGPADISTSPDIIFFSPPISKFAMVRNDNALNVTVSFSGLPKQQAYTMWWVIDEYDDSGDYVDSVVVNASGGISGGSGKLTMAGHLGVGPLIQGALHPAEVLFAGFEDSAFTRPRNANVFLVVLDHGDKIPGLVNLQISREDGACEMNWSGPCPAVAVLVSCGTSPGAFGDC